MRKLVVLTSAVVMVSVAFAGCTAKVQVQKVEDPPPKVEKRPDPPPKKKKRPRAKLRPIKKVKLEIELPEPVPFKTGSAELDEDEGASDVLQTVKDYMEENKEVTLVRVEGHTDSDGDPASNLELSKNRAAAATKWLVDNGISCKRLLPVGFGAERPLNANDTPENKAKNRRVSFFDAQIRNKAVNGDDGKPMKQDNGGKTAVDPCNASITK